jgi:Mn2+/Fe2+ NRAMP family transporter
LANFHEDFGHRDIVPPSERSTGLVFAAFACVVAALWYRTPTVWAPAGILSLCFLILSLSAPAALKPLNLLWFRLSLLLHKIMNPVVTLLIYIIAIVPTGLIMKRLGDPLQVKQRPAQETYWVERPADPSGASMKNQF